MDNKENEEQIKEKIKEKLNQNVEYSEMMAQIAITKVLTDNKIVSAKKGDINT